MASPRLGRCVFLLLLTAASSNLAFATEPTPEGLEFFETKIRPVLVTHCYECHSAEAAELKKLKGGLLLDTRAAMHAGGDSGEAIVDGKPDESLLISALAYESFEMPPSGKLPKEVIADFQKWIEMGAPDPRDGEPVVVAAPAIDWESAREHWAFQPVRNVAPPEAGTDWSRNDIDRFVRAVLDEAGLQPVREATKREWLRRVTFDLTGLPPTPEELDAFEKDMSESAYETVVDRLLESPRYGERWARHWLDVARYAEDQAHTFGVRAKTSAFRYRDWVIRALNDDMPYDRFVELQLAGDLVDATEGDHALRLAGLGFLGLGAEYYKNTAKEQAIADELDDRVDTVTRGFLGLTVSCARCHDHKFDPIPTRDYYALAGIFNGSRLTEAPLVSSDIVKAYDEGQRRVKEVENETRDWLRGIGAERAKVQAERTVDYVRTAWRMNVLAQAGGKVDVAAVAIEQKLDPYFLGRWNGYFAESNRERLVDELKPLFESSLFDPGTVTKETKPADVAIPAKVKEIAKSFTNRLRPLLDREPKSLDKADQQFLKAIREDGRGPFYANEKEVEANLLDEAGKAELAERKAELEKVKKSVPAKYPVAHVLQGGPKTMPVYIRGNPANKGETAPRGFLQILTEETTADEIDRLALAKAITDPANPLTARVMVNRIWQHHFGRGLVGTSSNFGSLGERPTHPELLDWLADRFVESGWSIKSLHRDIVLSATYRLSSDVDEQGVEIDPENRLLWRASRRRLDVEAFRDALLFVSGRLDDKLGGPTTNLGEPNNSRRTVYGKISRHELDGLLRLFDFPDANVTAAGRTSTTVPQQQLFVLNGEFFVIQAKAFAKRLDTAGGTDEERIRHAYRMCYAREPSESELRIGLEFLAEAKEAESADKLSPWEQYAQALLAANEFLYVD